MRRLALLCLLVGCGGSSGPDTTVDLTGTWIGGYTNTAQPGVVYQAVMQLEHQGSDIVGTITTNAGRAAAVDGFLEDGQFAATFSYTDDCTGEAATTADIVDGGTRLVGNYTSDDCVGETEGGYSLVRQAE